MVFQTVESIIEHVLTKVDPNEPVGMLNMLRFRKAAKYSENAGVTPCSGAEAYQRYSAGVVPIVTKMGVKLLLNSAAELIGPQDEWDMVFVVYYPTARDFVSLMRNDDYRKVAFHREAALVDSRLTMMRFSLETLAEVSKPR
jgi:uncharacterized protein (DUF1330 family)